MCYRDWPALGRVPSPGPGAEISKGERRPSKRGRGDTPKGNQSVVSRGGRSGFWAAETTDVHFSLDKEGYSESDSPALSIQSWLPSFPWFRLPGFPLGHVTGTFKGYKAAQLEISMGTMCLTGQYFLIVHMILVSYLCLHLFLRHGNQDTLIWCLMY